MRTHTESWFSSFPPQWEIRVRRVQTQFGIFMSGKIPKREFPILILVRQPYTRKFAVMQ
jgi:hypothetical protein